ncbi:NAC domain-containing protein 30-like [Castanea sativa]|uniref:NAC domain-containing protein 30-like n=1 Tax=Castanea sativa TaxID=21020 RepID=UPI003F6495FB
MYLSHSESNMMVDYGNEDDLLPCFRFRPTHVEIVEHYLYNKVHGLPLSSIDVLIECDLYGENDSWSWRKYFKDSDETSLYFFTKLKKVTTNGSRIQRSTPYGTWKLNNDKPIYRDKAKKNQIGSMRSLTYMPHKGLKSTIGRWVMHEFRLAGRLLRNKQYEDYVICRIESQRNKEKEDRLTREVIQNEEHSVEIFEQQKDGMTNTKFADDIDDIKLEQLGAYVSSLEFESRPWEWDWTAIDTTSSNLHAANALEA